MRSFAALSCCLLLIACGSTDRLAVFDNVYSPEQLPTRTFAISASRDTTVSGPQGTVLHIPANAFVDEQGTPVESVELEMKEVLDPLSMVLANMTTTSAGKPLQTGGMLWLGASSGGRPVSLAPDKGISVALPCDSVRAGMMRYTGSEVENGIDWLDPEPMVANEVNRPSDEQMQFMLDSIHQLKVTNVRYNVDGKVKGYDPACDSMVSAVGWAGDGLKISKDSSFMFNGHQINFFKSEDQKWDAVVGYTYSDTRALEKGTNWYLEDPNTHYLFEMKQLGWANIDRLYQDPRTQEVQFVTIVKGADDYPSLYVTLLIKEAGMYLPGYRRKDGTFCFSHGDDEAMELPVGAEVLVLATAYLDDQPHFAYKKLTIGPDMHVELEPEATSMDKMKNDLSVNI